MCAFLPGVRHSIRGSRKSLDLFHLPLQVGAEVSHGCKELPGQQTGVLGWS